MKISSEFVSNVDPIEVMKKTLEELLEIFSADGVVVLIKYQGDDHGSLYEFTEGRFNYSENIDITSEDHKARKLLMSEKYRTLFGKDFLFSDGLSCNISIFGRAVRGQLTDDEIKIVNIYAEIFENFYTRMLFNKELRNSEEKYRAVFENTGTATIIIEEDTTISLANSRFSADGDSWPAE